MAYCIIFFEFVGGAYFEDAYGEGDRIYGDTRLMRLTRTAQLSAAATHYLQLISL